MKLIPDIRERWVTPWFAVDWNVRGIKSLQYHTIRDGIASVLIFGLLYNITGCAANTTIMVVSFGSLMFEIGQGTMKFERDGQIHDGFMDPLDFILSPIVSYVVCNIFAAPSLFMVLDSYAIYLSVTVFVLAINWWRDTPPKIIRK